jgi:hypothetical protein
MPDIHGYPTAAEEIEELKNCCGDLGGEKRTDLDVGKLIEHLQKIWWLPEYGIERKGKRLVLHTCGWSGNEEIISVLEHSLFWVLFWKKSVRGGHYYFSIPGNKEQGRDNP